MLGLSIIGGILILIAVAYEQVSAYLGAKVSKQYYLFHASSVLFMLKTPDALPHVHVLRGFAFFFSTASPTC